MRTSLLFHKELLRQSVPQRSEGSATTPGSVNSGTEKVFCNVVTICDSDPRGRPFESTQLINHTATYMLSFIRTGNISDCVCDLKCTKECGDKKGYLFWGGRKKTQPATVSCTEVKLLRHFLANLFHKDILLWSCQKESRYFVDRFCVLCLHCEVTYEVGELW